MADQVQDFQSNGSSKHKPSITMTLRGMEIRTAEDAWRFAKVVMQSGLAPRGLDSPQKVMVAMQAGMEVGLSPMQALQSTALINGRPTLWGDAPLAIVQDSGLLEDFHEEFEGKPFDDDFAAVCYSKRKGRGREKVTRFSVADAKAAGLWGSKGPWSQYAGRMLQMRARSWNLRDSFPDVLKGMIPTNEAMDIATHEDCSRVDQLADKLEEAEDIATHEDCSRVDQLADKLEEAEDIAS